jgi:hypothetical protein
MRKTSTSRSKRKENRPKTKLGIPDLEHSKAAVLRVSLHRIRGVATSTQLMSSFLGTALNHD